MMESDVYTSIRTLLTHPGITVHEISAMDGLSLRQVRYRISKINKLLSEKKAKQISIRQDNDILVDENTRSVLQKMLQDAKENERFYFNKEERLVYMFLLLFLNESYVSLNHFMDQLNCSRSTVLMDLKALQNHLEKDDIRVEYNRMQGYLLSGSEINIRRIMMRTIIYNRYSGVYDTLIDEYHLPLYEYSRLVIQEMAANNHIQFVEDRLYEFIYIFTFLQERIRNGRSAAEEIEKLPNIDIMSSTKEYRFTLALLKNYPQTDQMKPAEIKYVSSWVLGISYGDVTDPTQDRDYISDLVEKIMTRFELLSGAHYSNQEAIFTQLYAHFRPAYYRLLFHLPIFNPLTQSVRNEYQDLYDLVDETMRPFSTLFGEAIPEDEIAYLTMHFAGIYGGKKATGIEQKNALVICSNGVGSSAILYNELKTMFPSLNFLPPIEAAQYAEVNVHVDIIFASRYAQIDEDKIPIVRVNPVMTAEEQYQIIRSVHQQLDINEPGRPNTVAVINIIRKYADIENTEGLEAELSEYFLHLDEPLQKEIHQLHLVDLLQPSLIRLNVEASDWKEAVVKSYEPLLANECITQNYVDATMKALETSRGYIVITKHVALAHTKPEDGALKTSMGFCTLKRGIAFGNKDNDPVKYIFSLSATDNQTHLLAMAELLNVLNDPEFFTMADKAESPQEILDFIRAKQKQHGTQN